jgi:hypothetical protein
MESVIHIFRKAPEPGASSYKSVTEYRHEKEGAYLFFIEDGMLWNK